MLLNPPMGDPPELDMHPSVDTSSVSAQSLPITSAVEVGDDPVTVKKKRGRPPKVGGPAKAVVAPMAKRMKEEEDVCFICFDGGDLVLCDRRDCPKAYHPACIKRDESFFTPKLRWNCGWHLCNSCQRNALFMCYTCPYSLCKTCVKQADISCVRGNKGFCKHCMTTILLIENIKQGNDQVGQVDFDDTTSWEYLFKVYWVYLKQKESLTLDELTQATNPWKIDMLNHVNNHVELSRTTTPLDSYNNQVETNVCKRRKTRKQLPMQNNSSEKIITYKLPEGDLDWASKELLEFVSYVKNGDKSKVTQSDVQALLLEYIRKNKLRDSRRKCQITCDKRLEGLFGKTRLDHFEMLKLLEYHFKDSLCATSVVHPAALDSCASEMKLEECSEETNIVAKESRQAPKNFDERERHIKLDTYAAIDVHNMSLIYLRRSLMENLLEDFGTFHDKAVGSIVRIRIADNDLKQEMYRLVQVVGTGKAVEPYKVGDKTAHVILKILNLDKIEDVRIDAISNQDLSEDECVRLCHNIKRGLVERMTVGDIHKKAIALQEVRIKDVLETEISKLNHLRDRASETGHRKELRECVEKLELLKSPEERLRRMQEIPEVHVDPMCQADEASEQSATDQDVSMTPIHSISNSSAEVIARSSSSNWDDSKRNVSDRSQIKEDDAARSSSQSTLDLEKDAARILEELRNQVDPCRVITNHEVVALMNHPRDASDASVTSSSRSVLSRNNMEFEKIWHYQDPSGKTQGPFCMLQLRKWNSDGYFPTDLRIWRIDESQDKSLLLNDAVLIQCNEDLFQSYCLDPHQPRYESGCRSSEHGGSLSININAPWTNDKPHGGCNSDLINAVQCSDDQRQPITAANIRQEADLDSNSQVSLEENHRNSLVVSSPGGDVSNACHASSNTVFQPVDQNHKSSLVAISPGEEVSNTCLASKDTVCGTEDNDHKSSPESSRDTVFQTVDGNHKPDCPEMPSLMPNGGDKDSKCLDAEPQHNVCALNVSNCMSGSGGHEFPDPLRSTIKLEPVHESFQAREENKVIVDARCEAEEHNLPVRSFVLEQNPENEGKTPSGQTNLPGQTSELNNEVTKSHAVEFKEPVGSFMDGQDSFTSWQALSSGIGFSALISSANQNGEGAKGLGTDLNQDIGFSWSSAAPLESETGQWAGYSMQNKSCVDDLDTEMKFNDHSITTNSASCQFTHSLSAQLDCNASIWQDGLIELSTLGDESVSDLLSEVEAMESLHGNSRIDFGDYPLGSPSNECFSPLITGKHDSWSSNCDLQFRPQPTITYPQPSYPLKQEFVPSEQDFLSLNSSGVDSYGHPPTSLSLSSMDSCRGSKMDIGSLNLGFVSLHHNSGSSLTSAHMEVAAAIPAPTALIHADVMMTTASSPVEEGEVEVAARLSLELSVNSPRDQLRRKLPGIGEEGKTNNAAGIPTNGLSPRGSKPSHRSSAHPATNQGNRARHHHQNIDLGPGFLKPAKPWSRQSSFSSGGGGGGFNRGQRVCKFYESGYCKRGASCNYLHT